MEPFPVTVLMPGSRAQIAGTSGRMRKKLRKYRRFHDWPSLANRIFVVIEKVAIAIGRAELPRDYAWLLITAGMIR